MKTPAPGPYEVAIVIDEEGKARGRNGERWVLIKNADGAIASVYPGRDAEATANLLAASWELLDSLRPMVAIAIAYSQFSNDPTVDRLVDEAEARIAKATGEPFKTPPGRADESPTKPEDPTEAKR